MKGVYWTRDINRYPGSALISTSTGLSFRHTASPLLRTRPSRSPLIFKECKKSLHQQERKQNCLPKLPLLPSCVNQRCPRSYTMAFPSSTTFQLHQIKETPVEEAFQVLDSYYEFPVSIVTLPVWETVQWAKKTVAKRVSYTQRTKLWPSKLEGKKGLISNTSPKNSVFHKTRLVLPVRPMIRGHTLFDASVKTQEQTTQSGANLSPPTTMHRHTETASRALSFALCVI